MRALEIGPGNHPVDPTWTIMDMVKRPHVDIIHDVRICPLPVGDNQYDLVYMSHILEHVPWFNTVEILKEVHRILKPGGTVEIWVPDFEKIVKAYTARKPGDTWFKFNPDKNFMTWINGRIFTYGPGDENWHRAVFDYEYLTRCLEQAGYRQPKRLLKPRGYDHGAINLGVTAIK